MNNSLIIVPTYNEAENISELIDQVLATVPGAHILIVDDNSPDGTGRIVTRRAHLDARVHLLHREKKEGLAAAYQAGFKWGLAESYDYFLQMDADFSHSPLDAPRLLARLTDAQVAIGCRYIDGGSTEGWSFIRQGISRGGNTYAQIILRLPYKDLTGGFNAWRREALEKIRPETIRSRGYAFQVEMKYRAHKNGFMIREMPIHFENRKYGKSKMSGRIVWEAAFRVWQMKILQQA